MIKEYWEEIYKKEKLVKTKKGTGRGNGKLKYSTLDKFFLHIYIKFAKTCLAYLRTTTAIDLYSFSPH